MFVSCCITRTTGCYSICEEPREVVEEEQTLRLQLLKGS
ncbi:hypothetical protein OIU78_024463 [Salix suchowensis]|uniref:Uncharacterized protein n=1 Tax=Salix purpurea TaxID=77065 RepID=A0A9Q1AFK9_SALPP|nr:hypothetical protein OIU78_024463 [Salix suchowensis]KAJ6769635.1 hypothetical protein OIU79_020482 [Salix purpurea]